MKKKLVIIGIVVVVLVVGGYLVYLNNGQDEVDIIDDGRRGNWEKPDGPLGGLGGGAMPVTVSSYPGATVGDNYDEDGMAHIEYETAAGVTAKQVLDYYENNLMSAGWQVTMRDKSDSRLEMLSEDGSQLRVSIFFTGYGDQGLVYFVDNRAPGGAAWPPMSMQ